MNPFQWRTGASGRRIPFALAACGMAAVAALSGCSAGQVAQTATQEAAVNGSSGRAGYVVLRNVHLRADLTTDYVQPGRDVELIFVAANASPDVADKLVSITSDIGSVTLTGDGAVPVNGVLVVGTPDGQPTPLDSVEAADAAKATVALSKPVTNGLNYDFTFTFEKAGEIAIGVPISAGEAPRREAAAKVGDSGGH